MKNIDYKNESFEGKCLENMWNYQQVKKVKKNSLLQLEKDLMELKDRELEDRKKESKREIEELFHKSKDD